MQIALFGFISFYLSFLLAMFVEHLPAPFSLHLMEELSPLRYKGLASSSSFQPWQICIHNFLVIYNKDNEVMPLLMRFFYFSKELI